MDVHNLHIASSVFSVYKKNWKSADKPFSPLESMKQRGWLLTKQIGPVNYSIRDFVALTI